MYHYIRAYSTDLPNFNFLHINDFKKQLDYFQEHYVLLSKEQFIHSIKERKPIANSIVLTFDDGLKDHYSYVLPELKKRGLFGIFYIPTLPYTEQKLLNVHRIHILLGAHPAERIYDALNNLIDDSMLTECHKEKFSDKLYRKQENSSASQKVKELLNYHIDYIYRETTLDKLMQTFFPDEATLAKSFYMTEKELQAMQDTGMLIGSHADSHSVMSKLSPQEQYHEIHNSFSFLEQTLQKPECKTFCYPYGGFHTFTNDTEALLNKEDVVFSFNVDSRDITANDIKNRPQALPRYDCNEFEYGKVYRNS